VTEQPTLTDGTVTLRPWRDDDVAAAVAGHDEVIQHWFGFPDVRPTEEQQREAIARWRRDWDAQRRVAAFAIEVAGELVGCCDLKDGGETGGELTWALFKDHRGQGYAARAIRALADWALTATDEGGLGLSRVEAKVEPGNAPSLRVATRSGLRREGVRRMAPGTGDREETSEYVVLARLRDDPPLSDPESFRSLLNSFLPRKRAIGQMLIRDEQGRVLLCQLTYKRDWDLPGGVVEVGESPRVAVGREVREELGLDIDAGALLLTDWLPPWGGWDDAVCLVFDGGTHDPAILDDLVRQEREIRSAAFCDLAQVRERCADFTARRIEAALASQGGAYTESGVVG
jgi:RimJ/RimL family protein N-acetyltransferase/8-oxo-dGTP pyrophosphatase MutT (NUDIX family)